MVFEDPVGVPENEAECPEETPDVGVVELEGPLIEAMLLWNNETLVVAVVALAREVSTVTVVVIFSEAVLALVPST